MKFGLSSYRRVALAASAICLSVLITLLILPNLLRVPAAQEISGKFAPSISNSTNASRPSKAQAVKAYVNLPLSFEPNHGQTDGQVKFLSRGDGYNLFLTATEATLALNKPAANANRKDSTSGSGAVLRMKIVGGKPARQVVGLDELPGRINYFVGADPGKWRANVPTYAKVEFSGVYPGVDLVYYGNQRRLEYDLIIAPGVDPSVVKLSFDGAREIRIDRNGELALKVDGGELRQDRPFVYQEVDGVRRQVAGRYTLNRKREVGFEIGQYDASKPLVIDPALSYSSFLGGVGADQGNGVAVDGAGNAYVTGTTASIDFPTGNALQNNLGGLTDAFVMKINTGASGAASLVYCSYLGGAAADSGNGIALDSSSNVYVTGATSSSAFPVTANAFQTTIAASIVYKSANGGGAWLPSGDGLGTASINLNAMAIDPINTSTLYAGTTSAGVFKSVNGGGSWSASNTGLTNTNVKVIAVDPVNSSVVYAATAGGVFKSGNGGANWSAINTGLTTTNITALTIDPFNTSTLYAAGVTSPGPATVPVFKSVDGGANWTFLVNLVGSATSLIVDPGATSTIYAGTNSGVHKSVDGGASWTPFFTSPSGFLVIDPVNTSTLYVGNSGGVFKSSDGGVNWNDINNGLTDLLVNALAVDPLNTSTLYAGTSTGVFKSVDGGANWGLSNAGFNRTVRALIVDPANASKLYGGTTSSGGANDAFLAKLSASGSTLLYSTYFGGGGDDLGFGVAVNNAEQAYLTGVTTSTASTFPTANPLQPSSGGGGGDAFVTKIDTSQAGAASLIYSSFLGGSAADTAVGIALDNSGRVYVSGTTSSANFPTVNPLQPATGGASDAFVAKIDLSLPGSPSFVYSTYLGGASVDQGGRIIADSSGAAYVVGNTSSANFPVTPGAFQTTFGGGVCGATPCADGFVAKLNAAGSSLIYSTFLGGSNRDVGNGVAVDGFGNAYVSGNSSSSDFPTANALQSTIGGGVCGTTPCSDVIVAKLNATGSGLIYSTYLGGGNQDSASSIALDGTGAAYVTGSASSTDFPATSNAFQPTLGSASDALLVKISPASFTPTGGAVAVQPVDPNTGATPVTITFSNVAQSGFTSLEISNSGPAPPLGFALGNPPIYYELSTTAVFSGPVQVCINYTGASFNNESSLKLFHREGGVWVDRTISLNTAANVICASVTSFSPFAIFEAGNLPPMANAGGPYSVNEGGSVVVTASGSDPEGVALSFAWDLDNNGSFETPGQSVTFSAAGLDGPGARTIKAQVTDGGGLSTIASATVSVLNVAPVVGAITAPVAPIQVDTSVNASASFTDPGALDTHTAVWNWGDGATPSGVVSEANGSGSASGDHIYSAAGVYTVTLTVTDKDGAMAQSVFQYVVVYDPSAGFVTGGGWINSPAGAYVLNPSLTGKANFGFVSKYKKGASEPSGDTQFNFHMANMNFQSTSYQWLVIAGPKAQFKGEGVINGGGSYGFMLTAIDGQLNGGGGVDKFRIKIWDKATGNIVYDNQIGGADDADPSQALGGGSIVIHKQ